MTVRLRVDHGQDAGKTWRLAEPGIYVLGRQPGVSLRVIDMKVSKEHARITLLNGDGGDRTILTDCDSTHGTLLNGQPVQKDARHTLRPGDEIRLGLTILRVLSDGEADEVAHPWAAADVATTLGAPVGPAPRKRLPPDELVGREIGGYRIQEKIGQGGMGAVYLAEQMSLNRQVAMKLLSPRFTSDRAFVDQFVNEARAAGALNHPNVVQVYDVGREDGRYFFSMEYVHGGSLEERLREGTVDWRDALNWLIDAANALIFAQKRGIIHRDVKPDNLMISEDGSAKLCDLGLAKKSENADLLAAGIIGTPAFISPEAIRRKKEIDGRSDLYSLGCTFYRILAGKNPYSGASVKEMLMGHLNAPVPRISDVRPDVPKELVEIVHRLMQKDPEARFASAEELLVALDRLRVQHGLEAHGIRPHGRRPFVIAALAALLAVGALGFALTRGPEVVVPTLTPEEIAIREEQERKAAEDRRAVFHLTATDRLKDLQFELQGIRESWEDPKWEELAERFERHAEEIEAHEKYGSDEAVRTTAGTAREQAEYIRSYVKLRASLDKELKAAHGKTLGELRVAVEKRRKAFDDAIEARRWQDGALLVRREAIDELLAPFLEIKVVDVLPPDTPADTLRRFGGDRLLDPRKDVQPLVERHFPGEPQGAALLDHTLGGARTEHERAAAATRGVLANPTREALEERRVALAGWLARLPEKPDDRVPRLPQALAAARAEAKRLAADVASAQQRFLAADLAADRRAYVALLTRLWHPTTGLLFTFRPEEALRVIDEEAPSFRWEGYRERVAGLRADAEALLHVLNRIVETGPSNWIHVQVEDVDAQGRVLASKVHEVLPEGVRLLPEGARQPGDVRRWIDLGPHWMLRRLLYTKEGAARFALGGLDHRGLAVLAEMAVEYPYAERHWKAFAASEAAGAPEVQRQVARRLEGMPREREAGEAWRLAIENLRRVRAFWDRHDPDRIGEDEFWKPQVREAVEREKSEVARLIQEAQDARRLLEDPLYATTVWVSVLSEEPDVTTPRAGEPAILPQPEAPAGGEPAGGEPAGTGEPPKPPAEPPAEGTQPGTEGAGDAEGAGEGEAAEGDGAAPEEGSTEPAEEPDAPGEG